MKTYSAKPSEVTRVWYILDASEIPLGRLSTKAASLLIGKGKPSFTNHVDVGDYVIVINAKNVVVTGNKLLTKAYFTHSQYPGGIKHATLAEKLAKDPSKVIEKAVRGMLPVNKLRSSRLARLKVYSGTEHNHEAQKPQTLTLKRGKQ